MSRLTSRFTALFPTFTSTLNSAFTVEGPAALPPTHPLTAGLRNAMLLRCLATEIGMTSR